MNHQDTLSLLREALAKSNGAAELAKAFTQSGSATTGLTAYDLEAPAKTLYPVLTPLRNIIPRIGGGMGIQANWKAITGINTARLSAGIGEGQRGGIVSTTVADYYAAYKSIGLDDYVTFEADLAAQGFDDVKARATQGLLRSVMIQEELLILGGNTSVALGTTPTPTVGISTTGGTIAHPTTVSVICVALTLEGYNVANMTGGVQADVSRSNADGTTANYGGGAAQKSAAGSAATASGSTNSATASVAAVRGAVGYAWYAGTAGSEKLYAITTINSVVITELPGSGQAASALPSSDKSQNTLVYDGLMYQAFKSGSNAYYKAMATGTAGVGTGLTAGTDGTISEIDTALQYFWDNYRLSPDCIWISSQESNWLRKKVLTGASTAAQRFVFSVNDQGNVRGGTMLRGYTNPFTMGDAEEIPLKLHPNMPAGTMMFTTSKLPYTLSNVQNVMQIRTRKEYHQIEWPLRTRKYEYGVYCDSVLQHHFPPSLGVITNIAPA